MKYIVQLEVSPKAGAELEANPDKMQALMGAWQAHNPIEMYFSLTRRRATIILEATNEDAFWEALHRSWMMLENYPEVWPVADQEEFSALIGRIAPK